ncbi:MAG: DUF4238 domain-containing protein [Elusimicrobiota bacterium]
MEKKKQHIIPRCYLQNFTDKNDFVYVLGKKNKKTFKTKPINILTDNYFYTIKFPEGGGSFIVENTLEKIESKYTSIFKDKINKKKPLNSEERALISVFAGAMLLRTKTFRKNIHATFNETEEKIEILDQLPEKKKRIIASFSSEPSTDIVMTGEEFKRISEDVSLFHSSAIMENLTEVSKIISKMQWNFLISERKDNFFITSDNPCVLINVTAIKKYGLNSILSSPGLLHDEVELSLPLSSQVSLLAGWKMKKEGYLPVLLKIIDQINVRTIINAKEMVIGRSNEKLNELFL